jgi:hypothetical protein
VGVSFLITTKKYTQRRAIGCNCIIGKYVVFWGEISSPALTLHTVRSNGHANSCYANKAGLNCYAIPGFARPKPFKMIDVQFTL